MHMLTRYKYCANIANYVHSKDLDRESDTLMLNYNPDTIKGFLTALVVTETKSVLDVTDKDFFLLSEGRSTPIQDGVSFCVQRTSHPVDNSPRLSVMIAMKHKDGSTIPLICHIS